MFNQSNQYLKRVHSPKITSVSIDTANECINKPTYEQIKNIFTDMKSALSKNDYMNLNVELANTDFKELNKRLPEKIYAVDASFEVSSVEGELSTVVEIDLLGVRDASVGYVRMISVGSHTFITDELIVDRSVGLEVLKFDTGVDELVDICLAYVTKPFIEEFNHEQEK